MAKHRKGQTLDEYIEEQYTETPGLREEVAAMVAEMELEQDLVALRERSGMSQTALATRLGVSQPAVAKLETSKVQNAKLSTLVRYCAALGARLKIEIETPRRPKLVHRSALTGSFVSAGVHRLMTTERTVRPAKKRRAKA